MLHYITLLRIKQFFSKTIDNEICSISLLGQYGLTYAFFKFFCTHVGFLIFTSLHSVFVNTLFMKLTGDSDIVMKFNIIMYTVWGITMLLSVIYMKVTSPVHAMRLGIFMYILMYLAFFMALDHLVLFMPLIASLAGIGGGCYWLSNNMCLGFYLSNENRDKGLGIIGVGTGYVSLIVPFLSGIIISQFIDLTGYIVVFALALLVAGVTILLSFSLPPIIIEDRNLHYKEAFKICIFNKSFFWLMISNAIKGIRDGTMVFFLNLLLYEIIQNEFIVGVNTLLTGIAYIITSLFYSRLIKPTNRIKSMYISTHILFVGAIILLFQLSPFSIMIFSILNTVLPFF